MNYVKILLELVSSRIFRTDNFSGASEDPSATAFYQISSRYNFWDRRQNLGMPLDAGLSTLPEENDQDRTFQGLDNNVYRGESHKRERLQAFLSLLPVWYLELGNSLGLHAATQQQVDIFVMILKVEFDNLL